MHLVDITMFYAAEGGGVSTYLNAKSRWLAQHSDIRHSILSPNIRALRAGTPGRIHVPSIPFPGIHGYRMPLSVRSSAGLLRALRPDLIEAGDAGHCAWAALRVRDALAIPAVAFYHSDLPRLMRRRFGASASRGAGRYLARLYRQFDLVLAPSRLMVDQLAAMGVAGAVHQPLGIDATVFRPLAGHAGLRDKLNLGADARLLVYAGRFTAEKKLDLLLAALRMLGPPYHLLLIGGGGNVAVHPAITRLPFCRDQRVLARLLAGCDVLVHPGDCETFGLIVLEAMACGLPVVATGGAITELVDERSGVVVRPDSAASLAEGIAAIYDGDRAALGGAARRRACEHYDWNQITPQLLRRYGRLLARARTSELDMERLYAATRRAELALDHRALLAPDYVAD
jgi:alpha-1,6-mannosyltransferase